MNRIDVTLGKLANKNELAFIGLAPISPCSQAESVEIGKMLVDAGVDILMIHLPNCLPWMEGAVLQKAAKLPRNAGVTRKEMFEFAGEMRCLYPDLPIIAMSLFDTVLTMGMEEFIDLAISADIDGFDLPNYPLSYIGDQYGFYRRTLEIERHLILAISYELALAPEGTRQFQLLSEMIDNSRGFSFVMNAPGGQSGSSAKLSKEQLTQAVSRTKNLLRQAHNPSAIAIVCGISGPEDIAKVRASGAQSFMIGSAYIKELMDGADLGRVSQYIQGIKAMTLPGGVSIE